jgi:hypothetical protein
LVLPFRLDQAASQRIAVGACAGIVLVNKESKNVNGGKWLVMVCFTLNAV